MCSSYASGPVDQRVHQDGLYAVASYSTCTNRPAHRNIETSKHLGVHLSYDDNARLITTTQNQDTPKMDVVAPLKRPQSLRSPNMVLLSIQGIQALCPFHSKQANHNSQGR